MDTKSGESSRKDAKIRHYKNLQEMLESPEYKEYIKLIRKGCEAGILIAQPPLPKEVTNENQPAE